MNQLTPQKAVIFYFSGTGNAKRIAQWFSEFAGKRNIGCKVYDIAACQNPDTQLEAIASGAMILIVSPTHGFNFPPIVLHFIRRFPKGHNRVALMNTRAGIKLGQLIVPGLSGVAFILSSFILRTKGYHIVGQIPFDMPSNWISIHPAVRDQASKYIHQINYKRVEKHAALLFSGKSDFWARRDLVQDLLISPISLAYYLGGRFVFAKSFYASAACNACGLCVKQCPVHAIKTIGGYPYWTFKCESCMHCMNFCPPKAIETAHGLLVVVGISSSAAMSWLLQHILHVNVESSILRLLLWTVFFLVFLFLLSILQHHLLRKRWVSKLISYTSFTHYKFWGRYKSTFKNIS